MYSAGQMCVSGYTRVDKRKARRLYNEGRTIYLTPCKIRPLHSAFTAEINVLNHEIYIDGEWDFARVVNAFEWYNCTPETGKYTMFFIKDEA